MNCSGLVHVLNILTRKEKHTQKVQSISRLNLAPQRR